MAQVHHLSPSQLLEKYEEEPHTIQKGDYLVWYSHPNAKHTNKLALVDFQKGKPIPVAVGGYYTQLPRSLKVLEALWPITWIEKYGLIQRLQQQSTQPNGNDNNNKDHKPEGQKVLIKNALFDFHVLGLIFQFLDQKLIPERYWHAKSKFSNYVTDWVWFDTKPYLRSFLQNGVKLMNLMDSELPMYYMETELMDGSWLFIMQRWDWDFANDWQPAPCCQQTRIMDMWNFVKSGNQPFLVRTHYSNTLRKTYDKFMSQPIFRNGQYRKVHVLFLPDDVDMYFRQKNQQKLFDKYHLLTHDETNNDQNSISQKYQHKHMEWLDLVSARNPWFFRHAPFPAYSN